MHIKQTKYTFSLFAGIFLFITIVFSGCGAEKTEPHVQHVNVQDNYTVGDKMLLQVLVPTFKLSEAENYAYTLWVKTESLDWAKEIENENIASFCFDENLAYLQIPEYTFRHDGLVDVQIDVTNKNTETITQLYVGNFKVFQVNELPAVTGTFYPKRLTFSVGEEMNIYARIPLKENEDLSNFEYSLFVKEDIYNGNWEQFIPYTNFKSLAEETENSMDSSKYGKLKLACAYMFEEAGTYSLQLNVRNLDSGIFDAFWLGDFTASNQATFTYRGIIRQILPAYDDIYAHEDLYRVISHDTMLASRYMYYKYRNNLTGFQEWLDDTYGAGKVQVKDDSVYFLDELLTNLQELNMKTGTLIYKSGTVDLDLEDRPAEKSILQQLDNEDPELAVMALVNYFLYIHYDYAAPFQMVEVHDLRFTSAHCGHYAKTLFVFAQNAGFETKWFSTADENNSSIHAVCQILIGDKWYTFDPTTNVIYREEVEKIDGNTPYIELFQSRNLDYLIGAPYWDNVEKYHIFAETSIEN